MIINVAMLKSLTNFKVVYHAESVSALLFNYSRRPQNHESRIIITNIPYFKHISIFIFIFFSELC